MDTHTETAPDVEELPVAVSAVAAAARGVRWARRGTVQAEVSMLTPLTPRFAITVAECEQTACACARAPMMRVGSLGAGSGGDVPGVR